jgi:hypothetical protein
MTLTDEDVDALRARLDAEPEPPACPTCDGTSYVFSYDFGCRVDCFACGGTGRDDPGDEDDSDGETDEAAAVEVEVPIIVDMDPDNLRVLHLTAAQWTVIDDFRRLGVPIRGVGEGCAYTPYPPSNWASNYWTVGEMLDEVGVLFRESPVLGGTFLLFDLTPAFPGA